jgi:hypothetical protein
MWSGGVERFRRESRRGLHHLRAAEVETDLYRRMVPEKHLWAINRRRGISGWQVPNDTG